MRKASGGNGMKDSEIKRLTMDERVKVIGCMEIARQDLEKILGDKGTLDDAHEFLAWAGGAFHEALEIITGVVREDKE